MRSGGCRNRLGQLRTRHQFAHGDILAIDCEFVSVENVSGVLFFRFPV